MKCRIKFCPGHVEKEAEDENGNMTKVCLKHYFLLVTRDTSMTEKPA